MVRKIKGTKTEKEVKYKEKMRASTTTNTIQKIDLDGLFDFSKYHFFVVKRKIVRYKIC